MEHLNGLLWSSVFLLVAAGGLARMVGWREMEALVSRAGVAVAVLLFTLPLLRHEAAAVRDGITSRTSTCDMPGVVVVGPDHLVGIALVVVGHVVLALWFLRRKARGDDQRRAQQQRDADRRRERARLPPRDADGGAA